MYELLIAKKKKCMVYSSYIVYRGYIFFAYYIKI